MNIRVRRTVLVLLALILSASLLPQLGCGGSGNKLPLVLAATSDLEETGILQEWVRDFKSRYGLDVELITATDSEIFQMAKHGECDMLITHVPEIEEQLESSNYVEGRQEIMHDRYVIVGPPNDPAGIKGSQASSEAMRKIVEAQTPFLLRTDGSGTSLAGGSLLSKAGVQDFGAWLLKSEAGMGETLRRASQQGAYTLSDLSTFQNLSGELNLEILQEGGEDMNNPYHFMVVSSLAYPDTNLRDAQKFSDYLMSENAWKYFSLGAWEPPAV
jgi:tungstate transport system substrate-binding protein